MRLYERAGGQANRTLHSHRHIAGPLGLSHADTRISVAALLREGLIAVDPMFDRLIALTPAGVAACTRHAVDTKIRAEAIPAERLECPATLHAAHPPLVAEPMRG